jgi:hypothetical protein
MSAPKVGCHARVSAKHAPIYAPVYGKLDPGDSWIVTYIEKRGRKAVYLQAGDRQVTLWSAHVRAIPRCKWCDTEAHSSRKCPKA